MSCLGKAKPTARVSRDVLLGPKNPNLYWHPRPGVASGRFASYQLETSFPKVLSTLLQVLGVFHHVISVVP